jgi:twitching motility protein PilI
MALGYDESLLWPDFPESSPGGELDDGFFGIRIGRLGLLVAVRFYCEVMESVPVYPMPNCEPWFGGLMNLRGNLVPVFDLHHFLGEAPLEPKKRRLFTIDKGEKTTAIWIDGLPQVQRFSQSPEQPSSTPPTLAPYVDSVYRQSGQMWFEIRTTQLFESLGRQVALST